MVSAVIAAAGAVGGALISSRGSREAAEVGVEGQEAAAGISAASAAQGRRDVQSGFAGADVARESGFSDALSFLSGAPSQQIAPFQQGNVAAQQQIGRGLTQQQNALLGRPTDLSGFQARQIGRPQDFNFDLSRFGPQQPVAAQPGTQQQFQPDPLNFISPFTNQPVNIPFNIDQFENPNFAPNFARRDNFNRQSSQ